MLNQSLLAHHSLKFSCPSGCFWEIAEVYFALNQHVYCQEPLTPSCLRRDVISGQFITDKESAMHGARQWLWSIRFQGEVVEESARKINHRWEWRRNYNDLDPSQRVGGFRKAQIGKCVFTMMNWFAPGFWHVLKQSSNGFYSIVVKCKCGAINALFRPHKHSFIAFIWAWSFFDKLIRSPRKHQPRFFTTIIPLPSEEIYKQAWWCFRKPFRSHVNI